MLLVNFFSNKNFTELRDLGGLQVTRQLGLNLQPVGPVKPLITDQTRKSTYIRMWRRLITESVISYALATEEEGPYIKGTIKSNEEQIPVER